MVEANEPRGDHRFRRRYIRFLIEIEGKLRGDRER